jgi:spermidine synthase
VEEVADMRRGGLYGLFFLSGASALIYEVVWQRLLNLVFGVSTLSVSAVLAAFMMGLALGGFFFGRLADRTTRPLWCYAWLEAGIGVAGLLVSPGFLALTTVYTSLHAAWELGRGPGACLRFGMALLVLVVPATLIGGTLPVMGRLTLRCGEELPTTFSLLYAVNTLGAVAGSALTGFVLLHFLGMRQTLWIAALLNLLVALGAGLGSRKEKGDAALFRMEEKSCVPFFWVAMGCAAMTGATSMALEVVWTRVLGILTSNSAYGFALVLTVLLLGLGLGGLLQSWWSRHPGESWRRLAVCQWLLAGITLFSLPFFRSTPGWLEQCCDGSSITAVFLGELALTGSALLVPAVLMGSSLPLLVAAAATQRQNFGRRIGHLYAVNTLGCVGGAFLAGFVLVPWLGIQATFGIILAAILCVGAVAWIRAEVREHGAWNGQRRALLAVRLARGILPSVLVILSVTLGWLWLPPGRYLKTQVTQPHRLLFYQEGNNATVSVVELSNGARSILVDGQPVAGTTYTSIVDQKMLAHLPLLLHPGPQHALTVGFGSGGTSHSMVLHGVCVDCVEIEAVVPAAAKYFETENRNILSEPRFRLIVDDARSWLRVAPLRYDVIVTDCTNIGYRSNGDLYTLDYFRLIKDRLADAGLAAAWVPANGIAEQDLKTLLRTFRQVFPHTSVWYMNTRPTDFLIVVGTPRVLDLDLDGLRRRMLVPAIAQDLSGVRLADPCRLLYTFLAADEDLLAYLDGGALNTDDRPILSYSTYGACFRATIVGNLVRLLACRTDVARFVQHAAPRETMMRHYAASNASILGHIAHLAGTEETALARYHEGIQLLPDDRALQELVNEARSRLAATRGTARVFDLPLHRKPLREDRQGAEVESMIK